MGTSWRCFRRFRGADVRAWITRDVIEPSRVLEGVGGPGNGATVLFLGHVRDRNDGRPVAALRRRPPVGSIL